MNTRLRVNEAIFFSPVHLIDETGTSRGTVPVEEALALARTAGLDLVEVNSHIQPPICKIVDFGKYKYEISKKEKDSKKKQKTSELKEVRFRMKTDDHDRLVKIKKAAEFLNDGHKVQLTIVMQGREQAFADMAMQSLTAFIEELKPYCPVRVDKAPERLGNRISSLVVKDR